MSQKKLALLIATRNPHKTREFISLLGPEFDVRDLVGTAAPAVEETGATFGENARLKAEQTSRWLGDYVLADDSGLEVDALAGAPGVFSARFAGESATDSENVAKLLRALAQCESGKRSARFRCVLAVARRGEILRVAESAVEGTITRSARGTDGFGYDPVFRPTGFKQTFGELPAEIKNSISHRARAVEALRPWLHHNLQGN